MLKKSPNTPAHLFLDDTPYFITGAIYLKRRLLKDSGLKHRLFELLQWYFDKYDWELHHWVILDDHYHLLGKSRKGKDMTAIFRGIHRVSGISIREKTACDKPVWWNYWDYCPRNEKEYLDRLNYLLYNPIKHGYTDNLNNYLFSSFHKLIAEKGREKLAKQFRENPDYKTLVLTEKEDDY